MLAWRLSPCSKQAQGAADSPRALPLHEPGAHVDSRLKNVLLWMKCVSKMLETYDSWDIQLVATLQVPPGPTTVIGRPLRSAISGLPIGVEVSRGRSAWMLSDHHSKPKLPKPQLQNEIPIPPLANRVS